MDVSQAIRTRRSVREYTKEDVTDEEIHEILEAGSWAPSGLNNQPWRFKILRGVEKAEIAKHTKYRGIIEDAPVCVAVFLDPKDSYDRTKDLQSIGACIQNMLLEAHNHGLGAVWLGEILNGRYEVQKALNIEKELMAVITIGHQSVKTVISRRKSLKKLLL